MNQVMYGIDFRAIKPIESVKAAECPVFIISGGKDDTVTEEQSQRLYQASKNPLSRLCLVPEAEHVATYKSRPEEYISRKSAFLSRH